MIDAGGGPPPARPLVIRSTPMQVAGASFLLLAVAIGAAFSEAPKGSKGNPWLSALVALVFAAVAIRVGTVRVRAGSDGLFVRNIWRNRRISWWDVAQLQVIQLGRSWRRYSLLVPRGGVGITVHLLNGDEVLLEATVRGRFRDSRNGTYGAPFDGWLAGLETFRRPYRVSWN